MTDSHRSPASRGTPHALYDFADVHAAMGGDEPDPPSFDGDPPADDDVGVSVRARPILRRMLVGGEGARWRTLVHPDDDAVAAVAALGARAPHMAAVTAFVSRRLRGAGAIGLPIRLPPILLLGPPGVGKSWYMAGLARALGLPFRHFPMNLATLADGLSGSHPIWRASAPGLVARTLLSERVANPVVLIDELDKPPAASIGGDLYRPLHALLEPENARAFVDDCIGVPLDASAVIWVASANTTDAIPAPILDRLLIVEVGAMTRDDGLAVLRSIFADLNRAARGHFDPDPAEGVFDHLASMHPRRAKQVLDDAMMRAAAEGRRAIEPADVGAPARPAGRRPRRRDVH